MSISADILLGKTATHLQDFSQTFSGIRKDHKLHPEVLRDLITLQKKASLAGFEMAVVSSFRSYEAQEVIWNAKVRGERPVLDIDENPLDITKLTELEKIFAIMRWSALPGASRHHWGTDLDVIDYAAIRNSEYKVQLTNSEASNEGPFGPFHQWLDDQIASGESCFFYRPYEFDLGGVSTERWHLSHAQISAPLEDAYDFQFFKEQLKLAKFDLASTALNHAQEIYERFVSATTHAPWG